MMAVENAAETHGGDTPPVRLDDVAMAQASLQERRPVTLKHGDTFAVFDSNGDAVYWPGSPEGIYHSDTRYLSRLELRLNGARPMLLSSSLRDDNVSLTCDLTNPDLRGAEGELVLPHDLIHIRRSRFLWQGICYERISVRNFDDRSRSLRLELGFAADFADLFEVRGAKRQQRGVIHAPEVSPDRVVLSYTGLDDKRRVTVLRFDEPPAALSGTLARYEFDLAAHAVASFFIEIRCGALEDSVPVRRRFLVALRDARRALRAASRQASSVSTSNEVFNEAMRRSVADLFMLVTETPQGPYPYAGIPWYSTVFGRDAIITALQTLWLAPDIARGVLNYLAANQAQDLDPTADAEPGKILHEVRQGEMAELGEVPFRRYYGSIDSTPLFVILAGAYLERTGDLSTIAALWTNIEAAIGWIERYGDRDGDGFVEYLRQTTGGLANQGWKDSHDSVFHVDGSLAQGPIALCEVQAYAYGAFVAADMIARRLGHEELARAWSEKADRLRGRFDTAFFDEELGTYVLALDGEKRPCRIRASNAGHALWSGIAWPERAASVVRVLMAASMFSGWGIRTVATTEARYNPMSYHNGSVWPHDNALIAAGMARYGLRRDVTRLFEGLFAAQSYVDQRRLPELFCGVPRRRGQGPTFYPVACIPQAWSATAPIYLLQSCLGLGFDPARLEVSFEEPALPEFLSEVVLRRLRIGSDWVDVALRRSGRKVVVDVADRSGNIKVVTTS